MSVIKGPIVEEVHQVSCRHEFPYRVANEIPFDCRFSTSG